MALEHLRRRARRRVLADGHNSAVGDAGNFSAKIRLVLGASPSFLPMSIVAAGLALKETQITGG
jgi:hypothetical protein